MNQLAQAFPTAYWSSQKRNSTQAFQSICNWKIKGLRPANHPHIRLKQYAQLWQKNPQWIESLQKLNIPVPQNEGHCDRKSLQLSKLNKNGKTIYVRSVWRNSNKHSWIDACLPLLSEIHQVDYFETWFYWYPGDFPRILFKITQEAEIGGHSKRTILKWYPSGSF